MNHIQRYAPNEATIKDLDRIAQQFLDHQLAIGEEERIIQGVPSVDQLPLFSDDDTIFDSLRMTRCGCPECKWFVTHTNYVAAFLAAKDHVEALATRERLKAQRAEREAAKATHGERVAVGEALIHDFIGSLFDALNGGRRSR